MNCERDGSVTLSLSLQPSGITVDLGWLELPLSGPVGLTVTSTQAPDQFKGYSADMSSER